MTAPITDIAMLSAADRRALEAYSRCEMTALDPRRRLGNATFGEVLRLLSDAGLPLPRAPHRRPRSADRAGPRLAVPEA